MESITASSTLLDVLGTLTGFAGVMLLLSLLVTSMVQAIQAFLQLRAKNLVTGVAMALEAANIKGSKDAITLAKKLLAKPSKPNGKEPPEVPGWFGTASWIDPSEAKELLPKRLAKLVGTELTDYIQETFKKEFISIQGFMSKQFQKYTRFWSLICAAVIAVIFQVNAVDLFRDLSVSPELREQYIAGTERIMAQAEQATMTALSYQEISDLALSQLGANHSELDTLFEEVSVVGTSQEAIIENLQRVLTKTVPDQAEELTSEYKDILGELYRTRADQALDQTDQLIGSLAYFNLDFWPHGGAYFREPSNWLGSLITVVLISLGAPFWFRWLRFLSGLRDALKPKEKENDRGTMP